MDVKTKIRWLSVTIVLCLVLISGLVYYKWTISDELNVQKRQAHTNTEQPFNSTLPPWPNDWDPWEKGWDPSGQFSALQKKMDDMMGSMSPSHSIFNHQGFGFSPSTPKISLEETTNEYIIEVKVPEGTEIELNTELSDNIFSISGKVRNRQESNSDSLWNKSISVSQFSQSMVLTSPIDKAGMVIDHKEKEILIKIPKIHK
jgi:HSP20 family molecular chaperone IbpA